MAFTTFSYSVSSVANRIASLLSEAVAERGRATLAIPGGSTPLPILEELARVIVPATAASTSLLYLDERAVPLGHKDRNDAITLEAWRKGSAALPGQVLPMLADWNEYPTDWEAALAAECARYKGVLQEAMAEGKIDVCLIGIGPDGHLASLFPQHRLLEGTEDVLFLTDSPKPPPQRVTLSLPVINNARHRIVAITGKEKGLIWKQVKAGKRDQDLPISLLTEEATEWYIDEEADKQ